MYKLTTDGVQRLSDGAFIPNDPRNMDWIDYQQWEEKNIPLPKDPEPVRAPNKLSELEARIAALESK